MKGIQLLDCIKKKQLNSIDTVATALGVSNATARRRLIELESAGLIELVRGGTFTVIDVDNLCVCDGYKREQISVAKSICGKIAASQVEPGDTIYIDNGTTVSQILRYLSAPGVTIYTNGLYHVVENDYRLDMRLIPGLISATAAAVLGPQSIEYMSHLKIDKAFVGATSYDDRWIYAESSHELELKKFCLQHATEGYIVMEATKKKNSNNHRVCRRNDYPLITEENI